MANVLIRVEAGTGAETRALYRALRHDPDLSRLAKLSTREGDPPAADELGPGLDTILAVVDGAGALGALLVSIAAWRDGRSTKWTVSVERDGVRIELQGSSREELERVVRALEGPRGGDT
ncbi:effector-associated constant component EACC1 [Microbispora triticiradicis]|uniref:effector-associated constant component EACC1 n=1 Tax=Microbispora triticiradicis TaxID=2200763 RepID=UPI001FCB5644|nr:hypothetical protein [Microbispora triticiradicis]